MQSKPNYRKLLRAVLFDLDGVLIDSESIYTEFWTEMNRRFPTGADNFAYVIKGTTLPEILDRYFPDTAVKAEVRGLLAEQERNMVYRPFPGALELLRLLRDRSIPAAIVTSSNRRKMRHLFSQLPELEELATTLVTDEDVTKSKPDPEGYLLGASRLGVEGKEFAVVEDSFAGLRAGRSAGATVVAIATTNPMEAVRPLADFAYNSIQDFYQSFLSTEEP